MTREPSSIAIYYLIIDTVTETADNRVSPYRPKVVRACNLGVLPQCYSVLRARALLLLQECDLTLLKMQ